MNDTNSQSETTAEAAMSRLLTLIAGYCPAPNRCAVAYSGGVDSAVVAKAAAVALGDRAIAVTGVSSSLAAGELATARETAAQIGIAHHIIATNEFTNADYTRNAPDRCFHCKSELYQQLGVLAGDLEFHVILNGTNLDDLGDYRPGLQAATDRQVRSPLAECGLRKADVRRLAAAWQLPVWDKPASPCLSSRVAYGEAVTPARLSMIDQAEQFLREAGFPIVRVRYHRNDLARIEVPLNDLQRLLHPDLRQRLTTDFRHLGFKSVTVDLEGFRSGNLNTLVPVESLRSVQ